jgi:SpoVK/Ycf46/Vps4 family AAA+-type ATPase
MVMKQNYLKQRPSRFDRVFNITTPNSELRAQLVKRLSQKIPVPEGLQAYIVKETSGFTPAQIQEVLQAMVISHIDMEEEPPHFTKGDADAALAGLKIKPNSSIGFNLK